MFCMLNVHVTYVLHVECTLAFMSILNLSFHTHRCSIPYFVFNNNTTVKIKLLITAQLLHLSMLLCLTVSKVWYIHIYDFIMDLMLHMKSKFS